MRETECDNYVDVGGVKVCRLELLPCERIKICPLEKEKEMVETFKTLLNKFSKECEDVK